MINQSSYTFVEFYLVDLPFFCGESSLSVAGKGGTWVSISRVFEIVVTDRELCVGFLDVWLIDYADIATAKDRAFFGIASDGELSEVKRVSFSKVDREDERVHWLISRPMFLAWVPRQRGVSSNNLIVFSFDNSQSMRDFVAYFMELGHWKVTLACSIKKSELLYILFMKHRLEEVILLHNSFDLAINQNNFRCWVDRWKSRKLVNLFLGCLTHINFLNILKQSLDLLLYLEALLKIEVGLDLPLLLHEESRKDLIGIYPTYAVVVALIDEIDEVHCLLWESVQHDPFLEIHVLVLYFFYESREEGFHLLLKWIKLGEFSVGVFADDIFQLPPLHLLTILMEQTAAGLMVCAVLADESRFAAGSINADEEARIAVNALRSMFDQLIHDNIATPRPKNSILIDLLH